VVTAIECLLNKRREVGIDEANPYIFARCSGMNSADGHKCLKTVISNLTLDRPDLVTTTYLRKYTATVSQLLNMKESEFQLLCNHMGHSALVHQDYYRLPSQTLELANVSKLLMAVQNGNLVSLCGKTLDEINIDQLSDDIHDNSDVEPDSGDDEGLLHVETSSSSLSDKCRGVKRTEVQHSDDDRDDSCKAAAQPTLSTNLTDRHRVKKSKKDDNDDSDDHRGDPHPVSSKCQTEKSRGTGVKAPCTKKSKLECGPMPNVMVALPNIGGALCSTPQSLADAHY